MFTDKNPFGSHPVGRAYQKFADHITTLVTNGKMDHTTAAQHLNILENFASEKQHTQAAQYIKTNSEKLGLQPKDAWFKDEKWGK
ncbi:MAG TPA: hypothetical protein VLF89_02620 [Candidatus Saccharimonadales bacterium]|nr:hypothetical protein [Candidatus Saccharimonadales bacterium]